MSALPLQGPRCRLFLPNYRSKILLFEDFAVKERCTKGKDLKRAAGCQSVFIRIVFRMLAVKTEKDLNRILKFCFHANQPL